MVRKIIAGIGVIFLVMGPGNLYSMFCESPKSPADESAAGFIVQPDVTSWFSSTCGQESNDSSDDDSDQDRKGSARDTIDNVVYKMLHTTATKANLNGQLYTLSPGQNLFFSIVALTKDSKEPVILWKKERWEAEGITLHHNWRVSCDDITDLIKKRQIGVTEHDDIFKLPVRESALWIAASRKDLDVMRVLLMGGASVNARAGDSTFPLFLTARDQDRIDDEKELLEYPIDYCLVSKADVTQRTADGKTALHQASMVGFMHGVCALTEKSACVNAQDAYGCTPLHYVCVHVLGRRGAQIARILLEAGARVDIQNNARAAPIDCALNGHNIEMVIVLLPEVIVAKLIEEGLSDPIARICLDYYHHAREVSCACPVVMLDSMCNRLAELSLADPNYGDVEEIDQVRVPHVRAPFCRSIALVPRPGKALTAQDEDTEPDSDDDQAEEQDNS